jgi:hypothetical protein
MFFSAFHSVGRFFSADVPSFFGPRHWGQLSADAGRASAASRPPVSKRRITAGILQYEEKAGRATRRLWRVELRVPARLCVFNRGNAFSQVAGSRAACGV